MFASMALRNVVGSGLLLIGLLLAALAQAQHLIPGPELNGAWFNTETPGQGLLVDINPELNILFAGWFTFRDQDPDAEDPENHRWYTFQGSLQGGANTYTVYKTRDGRFNDPRAVSSEPVGIVRLVFTGCNSALLSFEFDNMSRFNIIMARLLPVKEAQCEHLLNPRLQAFTADEIGAQRDDQASQYVEFLRTDSIIAGMYYLDAGVIDGQGPHGDDEVYYVLRGSAQLQAGGQNFQADAGNIHFVKAGVPHNFINITDDLEVLVLFSSAASSAQDPSALFFDLPDVQASHPANVNDWSRFLEVASMHFGSYSLPLAVGGDEALIHEVDEMNVVTHGSADFHVGSEVIRVGPGSMVWVGEDNPHFFDNLSEDFKVLILFHQKPGVITP